MKLKPVVASLIMLGLTAPVFAHGAKTMALQQAVVDSNSVLSTVCSDGWSNRITVGGRGSIVAMYGNHDLPGSFTTLGTASDLAVNDVNLLINAELCKWSKFTLNLAYLGANHNKIVADNMKENGATDVFLDVSHGVIAEEAYVTLSDFAKYPFYAKIGRMYAPFGEYADQHVPWQIESPAQVLAMTNGPALVVGVASDFGLYADVFALKGDSFPVVASSEVANNRVRNWGVKVGYQDNLAKFEAPNTRVNFNVSYINNIWDSLGLSPNKFGLYSLHDSAQAGRNEVGGISAHFDLNYKAFSMYADYTGALKDLRTAYYGSESAAVLASDKYGSSTKFWGANVNAAYAFETMAHDSSLGAGVQFSSNGQWFASQEIKKDADSVLFSSYIPKWRALVEYKVNLCKHTDLGLVFAHGKSYDIPAETGSSKLKARTTNVGIARLAFRF